MKKLMLSFLFAFGILVVSANKAIVSKSNGVELTNVQKDKLPKKNKNGKSPFVQWEIRVNCGGLNGCPGGTLCCFDTYAEAAANVSFAIDWFCSFPCGYSDN